MRPFAVVNGFVLLAAALSDALAGADDAWWLSWPRMWLAAAVRDGAVVVFLTAMTQGRARIGGAKAPETRAATAAGWRFLLLVAAPCDAALLALARRAGLVVAAVARASRPRTAWQIASASLHFVALSFAFELVFDLIHYLTHRTCLEVPRVLLSSFFERERERTRFFFHKDDQDSLLLREREREREKKITHVYCVCDAQIKMTL